MYAYYCITEITITNKIGMALSQRDHKGLPQQSVNKAFVLLFYFQSGFNVVRGRDPQDLERESPQLLGGGGCCGGRVQPGAGDPAGQGDDGGADEERGDHQGHGVQAAGKEGAQVGMAKTCATNLLDRKIIAYD